MKKSLFICLSLILLFGCSGSEEELPEESCYREDVNEELIEALKELNSKHMTRLAQLAEIYGDKTEPRRSSRVKPLYDKIDLSYRALSESFEKIKTKRGINKIEKTTLLQECQNFTVSLSEVVFKTKLPYSSNILDSLEYFQLYDTLIRNHKGQSYDTVLFQQIARNYYKSRNIIEQCGETTNSINELQILLAQELMLKSMNSVIMWNLSGCYAPFATSGIKVYAKRLNKDVNADSVTLNLNIALVLDVQAKSVFVQGLPGRGWVENENFYYKVENENTDSIIKGRMGIMNKAGEIRYRDFESKVYN